MVQIDAKPEDVGLSSDGLRKVDAALAGLIADGQLAGAVTLVARRGKIVHRSVQGLKDMASGEPLAHDTIFRIFSMTKPVTAAAMMILYDEGRWSPDDPIARHLPEFADVKVMVGVDAAGAPILARPDHPPTLAELMSHSAGLGYGFDPADPVDAAYLSAGVWTSDSLAQMSQRIAQTPLAYQPGTRWRYSIGMDVQGAIIEKLSGQSLPDFMRERIFKPLGMVDTDFYVPADKMSRLATLYRMSKSAGLKVVDQPMLGRDPGRIPRLPSGGGGLYSTAADYARFAQMLLNGGGLDGVQLIRPASVALMTANHLSDAVVAGGYGVGLQQIRPGYGHGFNGAVFYDPAAAGSRVGRGSYQWDGAAGTWFWIDPENEVVYVGLIQRMAEEGAPHVQAITQDLIADALL
jgi:CubicO group peptidase (beta-lactamase class C family)